MLRVDTRPRKRNAPRPAWKVATSYHQWLRGRPCACRGRNPACEGKIQAAHTPDPMTKGMATKAADFNAIPLSEGCHIRTQHQIGWDTFAARFLDGAPEKMAAAYWQAWPGRAEWERENG